MLNNGLQIGRQDQGTEENKVDFVQIWNQN